MNVAALLSSDGFKQAGALRCIDDEARYACIGELDGWCGKGHYTLEGAWHCIRRRRCNPGGNPQTDRVIVNVARREVADLKGRERP